MIWAVIGCTGCLIVVLACFAGGCMRYYQRERARAIAELEEWIRNFVTAPNQETPSPLAVVLDEAALLFAARLAQQLKAMLAGVESGESKSEQLQLIQSAQAAHPWLGILSAILPKRIRNKLLSNPQMVGSLVSLGSGSQGGNSSSPSAREPGRYNY